MQSTTAIWKTLFWGLQTYAYILLLLPIIVGLVNKKYWNRPLWIIFLYCVANFLLNSLESILIWAVGKYPDVLLPYLDYLSIENTFFLLPLYYLKNFLFISWFYSLIFPILNISTIFKRIGIACAVISLFSFTFIEGYQTFGSINPSLNTIYLVCFGIILPPVYLWLSRLHSIRIPLRKNPYLWISMGLLMQAFTSVLPYLFGTDLYQLNEELYYFSITINLFFNLVGLTLISIGFYYAYYVRFIKLA